jgi:hypothetical protein
MANQYIMTSNVKLKYAVPENKLKEIFEGYTHILNKVRETPLINLRNQLLAIDYIEYDVTSEGGKANMINYIMKDILDLQ